MLISYVIGACGSAWDQGPSVFVVDRRGEAGCLCLKTFEGKKMYLLERKSVKKTSISRGYNFCESRSD